MIFRFFFLSGFGFSFLPSLATPADLLHTLSCHGFNHFFFVLFNSHFLSMVQEGCMQLGWGSSLWEEGEDLMYAVGWFCFGKEGDCCNLGLLAAHLGKRKGHPPSLFAFIPPLK
jgi:hypothetical protein